MPQLTPDFSVSPSQPSPDVSRTFPCTSVVGPGGKRIEVLILYTSEDLNRKVRVLASPDLMRVFIHYVKHVEKHEVLVEEIRNFLADAGVIHGIDEAAIDMLIDLLERNDKPVGPFQVARGTRPRIGDDGWIEFLVKPSSRKANYDTDRSGKIDFRQLHLIDNALKGSVVAVIHPPKPGQPGRDVLGEYLPAGDGKPLTVRIGKNISADEKMEKLFADEDGRIVYEHNTVTLVTDYEITGNVDYRVGNIDFVGSVEIRGHVLDDFQVCGKKGVTIHGNVGNCLVRSAGDITIMGGINGRGKGRIVCGGSLAVKYVNDAILEVERDITVRKEILNSTVRANGCLRVTDGAIVGGDVSAFHGIESRIIGSDLGVATRIAAGMDWRTEDKIAKLDQQIAEMTARITQMKELLDPMLEDKSCLLNLTPEQKKIMQDLISELRKSREQLLRAQDERNTLEEKTPKGRVNQVNVRSMLHLGVSIRFSHLQANIKQSLRGPLSIVQDLKQENIRVLSAFELAADDAPDRPWLSSARDIGRL